MSLNPVPTSHYNCFLEPQITYFEINYFSLHVVLSLPMKITAMKITPSHKFIQLVKHTATTWPNLNLIPFPPWGQRLWSTWVFFKCVSFPSYATSRDKEKRMKSQTCWTNGPRPNLCFFSLSPHATSWHKANSPDTAPYRSSTDFSIFPLRHLVAQSRSPRHTAQSVSDRFFLSYMHHLVVHFVSLFSFFTLPRGTEQNSPTHCSNGPRSTFLFFFFPFLTPPCGTPPRRTEQKFSTHR